MDEGVLKVLERGRADVVTDDEKQERLGDGPGSRQHSLAVEKTIYVLAVLDEQLQVDLEHRLQQTHVRALVQSNLVLPDVDNEDFARRQRKEGTLALKVLVLAALATVCAFHVHDQDVLCHARAARLALILAHPDSLGCLAALLLGHDAELGAKEVVEEGRLAGGLRAEYGNKVVVEACWDNMFDVEVFGDFGAVLRRLVSCLLSRAERPELCFVC